MKPSSIAPTGATKAASVLFRTVPQQFSPRRGSRPAGRRRVLLAAWRLASPGFLLSMRDARTCDFASLWANQVHSREFDHLHATFQILTNADDRDRRLTTVCNQMTVGHDRINGILAATIILVQVAL
jgi:hypothetical protein